MPLERLRMLVFEKYGNVRKFEQATGMSQTYMSRILSGKKKPGYEIISRLIRLLGIKEDEVGFYFFPESCEGLQHNAKEE